MGIAIRIASWQLGVCSGDQNTCTRRKTIAVHFQSTKDNRARQTVNARRICNLRRDRHFTFAVTTPLISVNPLLLLASLLLIQSTSTSTLFHSSSLLVHSYLTSPLQSVPTSKPQLLLVEYIQSWAGGRKVFDVAEDAAGA